MSAVAVMTGEVGTSWPPQLTEALREPLPEARGYLPDTVRRAALIANDPALRNAAPAALAAIKAAMRPATSDEIERELRRLLSVYHAGDKRSRDQWNDFWSIYQDGLEGLSLRALKSGIKEYVRTSTTDYYPKPGVLRSLCEPHGDGLSTYVRILELALLAEPLDATADREQQHDQLQRLERLFINSLSPTRPARPDNCWSGTP